MPRFNIEFEVVPLELARPFTISRGTKKTVDNVFVKLSAEGVTGIGEAAPNERYEEGADTVLVFLQKLPDDFFDRIEDVEELSRKLALTKPDIRSAKAAVEMAWLDWFGKHAEKPLWELWNASSSTGPQTSYTIGLDEIDVMQEKVKEAVEYPILKVKLGTGNDRQIIRGIRAVTNKPLRVDANEGWTTVEEAKMMISFLGNHNVQLVEQPMPASMHKEMKELKSWSPIPLMADESFMGEESLERIAENFHGINIKLMKIGSLYKARTVIEQTGELGLEVMIGCMIESSLANTAGALLSLWADYADLDGHLLIKNDPADGLKLNKGKRVKLDKRPGLGVVLK